MQSKILQWFKDNRIKEKPDSYYLLINNNRQSFQIKIGTESIISNIMKICLALNQYNMGCCCLRSFQQVYHGRTKRDRIKIY